MTKIEMEEVTTAEAVGFTVLTISMWICTLVLALGLGLDIYSRYGTGDPARWYAWAMFAYLIPILAYGSVLVIGGCSDVYRRVFQDT